MDPQAQTIVYPKDYLYQPTYDFKAPVSFDIFGYVFPTFSAIAVNATQQQQIIIQADSDFELRRIVYSADRAGAVFTQSTRPVPNFTMQIQDSGSGRNLFNAAIPLTSVACYGDNPIDLPWPKIFARNSTVVLQLTNIDAAVNDFNIRVSFLGRKIYVYSE